MLRRISAAALALVLSVVQTGAVNVGIYTLVSTGVTTALSAQSYTPTLNLDGATAVSLEANFQYGSGGTSLALWAQTSCDGGTTWRDVARFDFTTSTLVQYANLSGLTAKAVTTYATLASAGVNDGLICNQLRAVITSVGIYANTTVSLRASVR